MICSSIKAYVSHPAILTLNSLLTMQIEVIFIFIAAAGLPVNLLIIYVVATASEKIAASELFYLHLSIANMLQLIARIPTVVIPDQTAVCSPMAFPCKVSLFIIFCSRKASIWFAVKLAVFHLVKLRNNRGFLSSILLKNSFGHLCLALNWVIWIAAGLPYPLLIPADRPRQHSSNMNGTCYCSFFDSLTENDLFLKTYDIIFGTVAQYLAIVLVCLVEIKVVWILLKHQQATFPETTSKVRSHQREIQAINIITGLVVFFVICHFIDVLLRSFSSEIVNNFRKVLEQLYPAASPFIFGFGVQKFRQRLRCIISSRPCQKTNVQRIITVS